MPVCFMHMTLLSCYAEGNEIFLVPCCLIVTNSEWMAIFFHDKWRPFGDVVNSKGNVYICAHLIVVLKKVQSPAFIVKLFMLFAGIILPVWTWQLKRQKNWNTLCALNVHPMMISKDHKMDFQCHHLLMSRWDFSYPVSLFIRYHFCGLNIPHFVIIQIPSLWSAMQRWCHKDTPSSLSLIICKENQIIQNTQHFVNFQMFFKSNKNK